MIRRYVRNLLAGLGAVFVLISVTPVDRWIAHAMSAPWQDSGQILIVLGGSMLVPGDGPQATMGQDTYLRAVYASWILKQLPFAYTVVTGNEGAAQAMASYLAERGVDRARILVENRASSTYENAVYSRALLTDKFGPGKIAGVVVLTSDYHSWRARRVFERQGFKAGAIPVPDVQKRSGFVLQRWPAFLLLLSEIIKDAYYFVAGRM